MAVGATKTLGFIRLTRPANLVTAVADILAGVAISGYLQDNTTGIAPVVWLSLATIGLYGGGVVFNDVCDAALDRVERPERPIPSGLIARREALWLAIALFGAGIAFAFQVGTTSGLLAAAIAAAAMTYDKWTKHNPVIGPLNMGLCRGLNLLLGVSVLAPALNGVWYLGFVPVVYIAAVTMVSRGEVHGGNRGALITAAALYLVAMCSIAAVGVRQGNPLVALPFIVLWAAMVFPPLARAMRSPQGRLIGKAVKAGVISLILMNASWAAAFGLLPVAILIAVLLPISILLARAFAVT